MDLRLRCYNWIGFLNLPWTLLFPIALQRMALFGAMVRFGRGATSLQSKAVAALHSSALGGYFQVPLLPIIV